MHNLENILEISTAISMQKKSRRESILEVVKDLFKIQKSSPDLSSIIKDDLMDESDSLNKMSEELFEKGEEKLEKKRGIKKILLTSSTLSSAKVFNKFKKLIYKYGT